MGVVGLAVGAVGCIEVGVVLRDALEELAGAGEGEATLLFANELAQTFVEDVVECHLVGGALLGMGTGAEDVDVAGSLGLLAGSDVGFSTEQISLGETIEVLVGEGLATGACQLIDGLVAILCIGMMEWRGHLGAVAAHEAVGELGGWGSASIIAGLHRIAFGEHGVLEVEVSVGHGCSELGIGCNHVGTMDLVLAWPVELGVAHIVPVLLPDLAVEVRSGIVGADATTTGHVADRPVEELEVDAIGGDDVELIDLRSEETLAPEAAWIPEEVAGVVAATIDVGLELDDPDALGVARSAVLVVGTEEVVEDVTILLDLRTEALGHELEVGVVDYGSGCTDGLVVGTCGEVELGEEHVGYGLADFAILHGVDLGEVGSGKLKVLHGLCEYGGTGFAGVVGLWSGHFLKLEGHIAIEIAEGAVAEGTEEACLCLVGSLLLVAQCSAGWQTADDGVGLGDELVVLVPIELGDGTRG